MHSYAGFSLLFISSYKLKQAIQNAISASIITLENNK